MGVSARGDDFLLFMQIVWIFDALCKCSFSVFGAAFQWALCDFLASGMNCFIGK